MLTKHKLGETRTALVELNQLLSKDPLNDFIYVALSMILEDSEEYKYADLSISRGLLLNPNSIDL